MTLTISFHRSLISSMPTLVPDEVGNHSGGDWGFLIEVIASNMDALGDAILDSLSQLEGGGGRTHIMVSFYDFEGWS